MPNPNDILIFFRDRVGAVTAISAIVAAGGALIAYLGLTSVQRVMLSDEYKRITGIRQRIDYVASSLVVSGQQRSEVFRRQYIYGRAGHL